MIFYTGDIHGSGKALFQWCAEKKLTDNDTVILLGDVGANYYGGDWDKNLKTQFSRQAPTFLCIHGNHEIRPYHLPTYRTMEWNGGTVWYEEAFPNLLFAKDGEIYDLEGKRHIAIGGAYSVDKHYRLKNGMPWWLDEQPSDAIREYVEQQLKNNRIDIILSHTCPYKYIPKEAFLPSVNQNTVDSGTERWLDTIEENTGYSAWFCGHWHIDKRIDRMHFLFHGIESASFPESAE